MFVMKESDQVTTTRTRGRPTVPESERKRARNLSVSDPAWQKLDERLKTLQIKTPSELLERIGLNQIQLVVQNTSPLADIPVFRRVKSLISEPVAVFWSVLAFVVRICRQFAIEPTDDKVYAVAMQACTITFYIGYTHPDILINNPSALMRWICYRIVQAESAQSVKVEEKLIVQEQVDPQKIEKQLWKIGNAFHILEKAAHSPDYEALKMKVIDGLTIKQISRIFKLQNLDVSKAEVSCMIKNGLANFRRLLYGDPSDHSLREEIAVKHDPKVWEDAREYIRIALQEKLMDSKSQQEIEEILLKTSQDPYLDFWLNEIDYDLGCQNIAVRNSIAETLEKHLVKKKLEIDRAMAFCSTKERMRQILETYASQEAQTHLPISLLLGEPN